jgi:hypothetical protein
MPHAQETAAIVPARSNQPKRVSLPLLLLRSPRTHWIRSTRTPLCYILVYPVPDDERSNPSPPSGDASQVRRGSSRCEATQRSSLERSWLAGSIQIVVLIDLGVATSGGGLCSVGCWPSTCIRLVSPQRARQALRESPLPARGLLMTRVPLSASPASSPSNSPRSALDSRRQALPLDDILTSSLYSHSDTPNLLSTSFTVSNAHLGSQSQRRSRAESHRQLFSAPGSLPSWHSAPGTAMWCHCRAVV